MGSPRTETDAAWESAIYNSKRAEKAEAEVERLRAICRKVACLVMDTPGAYALVKEAGEDKE